MKEPANPNEATQIRTIEWQCDVLYELGGRGESYSDVVEKLLNREISVPENYRDLVTSENPDESQQIRVTKGQRWDMRKLREDENSLQSYVDVLTYLFDTNAEEN